MSNSSDDPLLSEVEAFLAQTKMTPSHFGKIAVGDPRLVFDMRGGRELRRKTASRLTTFIQAYRASR